MRTTGSLWYYLCSFNVWWLLSYCYIFSCAFCCSSHLTCLLSVLLHICALFVSPLPLWGNLPCVFAQKRTYRGRACWLQQNSFCLFSVMRVQYALHVCTFTCSQILIGQQGLVKGKLKGAGEWKASTLLYKICAVSWVTLTLRYRRGRNNSGDNPEPKTDEERMKQSLSTLYIHLMSLLNVAPDHLSKTISDRWPPPVFLVQKKHNWKSKMNK